MQVTDNKLLQLFAIFTHSEGRAGQGRVNKFLRVLHKKKLSSATKWIFPTIITCQPNTADSLYIRFPKLYQPNPVHKFHDRINRVELEPFGGEVGIIGALVVIVLKQFAKHKEIKRG
jgi:hypothetical protein